VEALEVQSPATAKAVPLYQGMMWLEHFRRHLQKQLVGSQHLQVILDMNLQASSTACSSALTRPSRSNFPAVQLASV
jgi:hypothetical protein